MRGGDEMPPELNALAQRQYEQLRAACPEHPDLGGLLFLGKCYAEPTPGVLMLGVNPGMGDKKDLYCGLWSANPLLEDWQSKRVRYWTNARVLFGATAELRQAMERATYSFCCPFRTASWNGLPRAHRASLAEYSRPILLRIISDCSPRLVICAGLAGIRALAAIAAPELRLGGVLARGGDDRGAYRWAAFDAEFEAKRLTVVQIPHLSRASSRRRLRECGEWLDGVVRTAACSEEGSG